MDGVKLGSVCALALRGKKTRVYFWCVASVALRRVCDCDDAEKGSAAAGAFSDFYLARSHC